MLTSDEFIQRLIRAGIATQETIVPCSDADIARIEDAVGLHLPDYYQQFLLAAGKCVGAFMDDCSFYYPELLQMTAEAKRMLIAFEGNRLRLPADAFVFMDRRENFLFFRTSEKLSNSIIAYEEDHRKFDDYDNTFWGYVEGELLETEAFFAKFLKTGTCDDYLRRAIHRAEQVKHL